MIREYNSYLMKINPTSSGVYPHSRHGSQKMNPVKLERSPRLVTFWENEVQMWCKTTEMQLEDVQRRST